MRPWDHSAMSAMGGKRTSTMRAAQQRVSKGNWLAKIGKYTLGSSRRASGGFAYASCHVEPMGRGADRNRMAGAPMRDCRGSVADDRSCCRQRCRDRLRVHSLSPLRADLGHSSGMEGGGRGRTSVSGAPRRSVLRRSAPDAPGALFPGSRWRFSRLIGADAGHSGFRQADRCRSSRSPRAMRCGEQSSASKMERSG